MGKSKTYSNESKINLWFAFYKIYWNLLRNNQKQLYKTFSALLNFFPPPPYINNSNSTSCAWWCSWHVFFFFFFFVLFCFVLFFFVCDNGPQYISHESLNFAKVYYFKLVTRPPYYARATGKAEAKNTLGTPALHSPNVWSAVGSIGASKYVSSMWWASRMAGRRKRKLTMTKLLVGTGDPSLSREICLHQVPVVQRADNFIHSISRYAADKMCARISLYPYNMCIK